MDNAIDWCNNDYAVVSTDTRSWINRILRLANQHPEEVEILYLPEDNDGALLAHVPVSWVKVSPPRKHALTENQRAALRERMAKARRKSA